MNTNLIEAYLEILEKKEELPNGISTYKRITYIRKILKIEIEDRVNDVNLDMDYPLLRSFIKILSNPSLIIDLDIKKPTVVKMTEIVRRYVDNSINKYERENEKYHKSI